MCKSWSVFAGPLPLPCSIQTSLVLDDKWYLFSQNVKSVLICHTDIAAFVSRAKEHSCLHQDCQDCPITLDKMTSSVTSSWEKLLANSLDTLAFRITSIGRHIVMICHPQAPSIFLPVRAYCPGEKRWCDHEVGCMVPTCANATLVPCPDSHDLVVLGGDARDHLHSSNKVFRLSLKDVRYARRVWNGRGYNCRVTSES